MKKSTEDSNEPKPVRKRRAGTADFTQGPLTKKIILFALPLLAASLVQQLYNSVDLMVVGNWLGGDAAAAVGAGSLLITLLVGFFTGLSTGVTVVIGRCFGAKNTDDLRETVRVTSILCVVVGVVLAIVAVIAAPLLLRIVNTPTEIFDLATSYLRIYFIGIIPISIFNVVAGMLRGVGNSKSPLISQLIGGIANVVANLLFVVVFGWGVEGSAVATLVSQSVAASLAVRAFFKLPSELHPKFSLQALRINVLRNVLSVGLPAGVQAMLITLSNLVIQSGINSLDMSSVTAFSVYFKVELIIYLPILSIGQAASTVVAQNCGSGGGVRVRRGVLTCILIGLVITICLSTLLYVYPDPAFFAFVNEADVIAVGASIARTTFPFYFIYVGLDVLSSSIRGTGRSFAPMVIILANIAGVRIIVLMLLLSIGVDAAGLAIVYPVTWATSTISLAAYILITRCFSDAKLMLQKA